MIKSWSDLKYNYIYLNIRTGKIALFRGWLGAGFFETKNEGTLATKYMKRNEWFKIGEFDSYYTPRRWD